MTRPVAVLLDVHEPEVRAVIAGECPPAVELRMATSPRPDERLALARGAAFFIGGITPIPASLMDVAPGLRLIQKWGIGVDKIDLAAARARGIPVAITAGANAIPVAGTIRAWPAGSFSASSRRSSSSQVRTVLSST